MSNPYELASPLYFDVYDIAGRLRAADKAEVEALGHTPDEALMNGFNHSDLLYTILYEGKPCGMVGVGKHLEGTGVVWMLGTDELTANPKAFLRKCKERFSDLFIEPLLCNYVHANNEAHIRYLKWMGADFGGTVELDGHLFYYFEMRDPNV